MIKNKNWIYGEIIEIRERFNPFHYADIKAKPVGELKPTSRLSIPHSMKEGSLLFELIVKLNAYTKEGLIGKRFYYQFYEKPNPEDKNHFFRLIDPRDIRTEEDYELESKIKEFIENNVSFSIKKLNDFFKLK